MNTGKKERTVELPPVKAPQRAIPVPIFPVKKPQEVPVPVPVRR